MKNAMIIYQSKKGTTRQFGSEIGKLLNKKGIQTKVLSLEEAEKCSIQEYDYLFLGCWTKGLMVINQHPDKDWKNFASSLEIPENTRVNLFTTYKIAAGSMFSRMKKCLPSLNGNMGLELKSKNGDLSDDNAWIIDKTIK